MRFLSYALLSAATAFGQAAAAQTTPNHVFQRTEAVYNVLSELSKANFSTLPKETRKTEAAQPRHVLQLAREVARKTQLLRFINGLPTTSPSAIPVRVVAPADVKQVIDITYEQLLDLLPAYGVTELPSDPSLPSGKTPTDVYVRLISLSLAIDSLGIPATVPTDVHQLAQSVLLDTIQLARASGMGAVEDVVDAVPPAAGQLPKDAFENVSSFIAELETYVSGSIKSINHVAASVSSKTTEMVTSFAEQTFGINEIASAVMALDKETQQNSAMAEDLSQTTQTLDRQCRVLHEGVDKFSLNEEEPITFSVAS